MGVWETETWCKYEMQRKRKRSKWPVEIYRFELGGGNHGCEIHSTGSLSNEISQDEEEEEEVGGICVILVKREVSRLLQRRFSTTSVGSSRV